MPKTKTPHLNAETRNGVTKYYHRVGQGRRVLIEHPYDTPTFWAEYRRLEAGEERPVPQTVSRGSLRWLIMEYQRSPHWQNLKIKRQREATYRRVIETDGDYPFAEVTRAHIEKGMTKRLEEGRPIMANSFLQHMNAIFEWAVDNQLLVKNPCWKIRKIKIPKNDGFKIWSEGELEAFRRFFPVGTLPRLAFDIMHYTGLRRSDAIRLGPKHVAPDGSIAIRAQKNEVVSYSVMTPELMASINAAWKGGDTFLVTDKFRKPFSDSASFGVWFWHMCRKAGLDGLSAHGIRKATATAAAEAGATPFELMGMFGWLRLNTAALYTEKVNRKNSGQRAARLAAERNANVVLFPVKKKGG
jgi:integrase